MSIPALIPLPDGVIPVFRFPRPGFDALGAALPAAVLSRSATLDQTPGPTYGLPLFRKCQGRCGDEVVHASGALYCADCEQSISW